MLSKNLRRSFWDKPSAAPKDSAATQRFTLLAGAAAFETRYIGEESWWPIDTSELAHSLEGYHGDLEGCLKRMMRGEVLQSPLAEFRLLQESHYDEAPTDTRVAAG